MVKCDDVLQFWNTQLNSAAIPDASRNGLQVQGAETVRKIVFGVSASLELFRRAQTAGADLICVHHGLLWGHEQPLTGLFGQRVRFLMQHNIGLAAYHLPLDKHPKIGHNACLIRALHATQIKPFAVYHDVTIGYEGKLPGVSLEKVTKTLEQFCHTHAQVVPFGPQKIKRVGVVSGGAYSMLPQAIDRQLDLYVTGILDEPAYEWCREGKINCIALGHYHSEKCGIEALMKMTAQKFAVKTQFIDITNPL